MSQRGRGSFPGACIVIDSLGTEIGASTFWNYVHVGRGAKIGDGCTIGDGAHVGPRVVIGNGCKIQNGAQLFEGVTLEDDVFIGPHVVFTNVLTPRAFINRKAEFKPTLVKLGASIGANATILCGITIGEYAMIGAGAVVSRDVRAYTLIVGVPARESGKVCKCGMSLGPSRYDYSNSIGSSVIRWICKSCGTEYRPSTAAVSIEPFKGAADGQAT